MTTGEYPLLYVLLFGAVEVEKLEHALGDGDRAWRDVLYYAAERVEGGC